MPELLITPLLVSASEQSPTQDLHIVCDREDLETLVAEFKRDCETTPGIRVYDWGVSLRFENGYIVLEGQPSLLLPLKQRLDADPRIEGCQLYDLPGDLTCPDMVCPGVICEQGESK